ncbi:hypothetical protein QTP88_001837 [Uroleucon formosanum]
MSNLNVSGVSEMPIISPKRKNKKGKYVNSRQKEIIINIYKDVITKSPDIQYRPMISEISRLTGIGRETIINTISEYRQTGNVTSPQKKRTRTTLFDKIDDMDRNGIRQTIHSFWLRRELPTIDKILTAVNENPSLPNYKRTTLFKVIKKLDFVFTKRKRCSVLTERDDLICWLQCYLYDIRKYRNEGRTVYYLDETWLNTGDCVDHVWMDTTITSNRDAFNKGLTTGSKNPTGKGKRLIVLHIGSNNGFFPVDCYVLSRRRTAQTITTK